jgi:hypothetical protein
MTAVSPLQWLELGLALAVLVVVRVYLAAQYGKGGAK